MPCVFADSCDVYACRSWHHLVDLARYFRETGDTLRFIEYMDVGGGLGVDYDGSRSAFDSSTNYTLQEYANDVVYHVQLVCDEAKVPHPNIITESGRAIVAHHSVLVFNVLDVSGLGDQDAPKAPTPDMEQPLLDLKDTFDGLTSKRADTRWTRACVRWAGPFATDARYCSMSTCSSSFDIATSMASSSVAAWPMPTSASPFSRNTLSATR